MNVTNYRIIGLFKAFLYFSLIFIVVSSGSTPFPWFKIASSQALVLSGPIVVNAENGRTIFGIKITGNGSGPCIKIQGNSANIQIDNVELTGCTNGIEIWNSSDVNITNSYIHHNTVRDVMMYQAQRVKVESNRLEYARAGVYALESSGIKVLANRFYNISEDRDGSTPTEMGQMVQFNRVSGTGNEVMCNIGESVEGDSAPEDAINIYDSNGTSASPIRIANNKIKGGGPSPYGGGIILGDGAGNYQIAQDNILVNPGQYGVSIAGGNNNQLIGNKIYAIPKPWNNVGLYVWNQSPGASVGHTVNNNRINYMNSSNNASHMWIADNVTVSSLGNMTGAAADVSEAMFNDSIAGCAPIPASDTVVPSVPTGLTATAVSSSQITISWSASTDNSGGSGIAGYRLFRNGTQITQTPATSYQDTGLTAGTTYSYTVLAYDVAGNVSAQSAAVSATTQSPIVARGPYPGPNPTALPGTLETENYDTGGPGVAYNDTETQNIGAAYRTDQVDIEASTDGGYNVGNLKAGEWLEYTVNVSQAGTYDIEARVAAEPGYGGTFHIESNRVDKTGPMTLSPTGGWQVWTTIKKTGVSLAAGTQVLRIVIDTSINNAMGNINYIRVVSPTPIDTTAPVISGITSSGETSTSTTISWTTNEAADTQVDYGTTLSYGSSSTLNATLLTSHTVTVTGLAPSTTYNFRVKSRDQAGNLALSANQTFTTQAAAPIRGDFNQDGIVNSLDYSLLSNKWNQTTGIAAYDLKPDGIINSLDYGVFLPNWGLRN